MRADGGAGGAGGDTGASTGGGDTCDHVGGNGGAGGGAGRIKVVYVGLYGTPTYQLNGGAGGAGGTACSGATAGTAGAAGGGNSVATSVGTAFSQAYSGTVLDTAGAPLAGVAVRIVVAGRLGNTTTTNAAGAYTFRAAGVAGDRVLAYLDTGGGAQATTATVVNGSDLTGLDLRQGRLIVRNDNGGTTSNADLRTAKGSLVDADIDFSADVSNNLSVTSGISLDARGAYTPGANVTTAGSGGFILTSGTTTLSAMTLTCAGALTADAGTLDLSNACTINADGANPAISFTDSARLNCTATGGNPTIRRSSGADTLTALFNATLDVNGLALQDLGPLSGGREGFEIGTAATVLNFNDIVVSSNARGVYFNRTTGGPYTLRGWQFLNNKPTPTYNVRVESGSITIAMIVASGAGGDPDSGPPDNLGGEENDQDPGDSDPTSDTSQGQITWEYSNWKWLGGTSSAWNLAANWLWQGIGPAPEAYPGATGPTADPNVDPIAAQRSIWIPTATNPCVQDVSYNVLDLNITTGGAMTSGAAITLGLYGSAFKSTSGTFTAAVGNTVKFAGTETQVVIIIGGGPSGSFYDLNIDKSAASTASLGTPLTVENASTVTNGTFDLSTYTLTQKGALTVAAGATLTVPSSGQLVRTGAPASALTVNGTLTLTGSGTIDWSPGTGAVVVNAGGTLRMTGTSTMTLGTAANTVAGTLELTGGVTLRVPSTASLAVTGTFRASGTTPTLTRSGSGTYALAFNAGASIDVSALNVSFYDSNGMTVNAGAAILLLDGVNFTSATGTAACRHLALGVGVDVVMSRCSFDLSFVVGTGYNVVALTGTGTAPGPARTYSFSQQTGTGAGDGSANDRDLDSSEDASSRGTVAWARTYTWIGNGINRRAVAVGASVAANKNIYLNITGSPGLADTIFTEVGGAGNSGRIRFVLKKGGSPTTWVELQRDITVYASTQIECYINTGGDTYANGTDTLYLFTESVTGTPATFNSLVNVWSQNFEASDGGWTVQNGGAPTGPFEWGVPAPDTAQPGGGAGGAGSQAWVTGLAAGVDHDGSSTQTTSPAFSLAGAVGLSLTYYRFFNEPSVDTFTVEITDNRSAGTPTWRTVESLAATTPSPSTTWAQKSAVSLPGGVAGLTITADMGIRARYGNGGAGAANEEGGVDDFVITGRYRDVSLDNAAVGAAVSAAGVWDAEAAINWTPVGVPAATDDATIDFATQAFASEPTLAASMSCLGLRIVSMGGTAATDAFNSSGQTLSIGGGGFTMSGGSVNWTSSSLVTCKGSLSITTSASPGFAPAISGNTLSLIGNASLQTITMGGAAANTFGTLQAYNDVGSPAKTTRLLSNARTGVVKVGFGGGTQLADTTFDVNGFTLTVTSTSNSSPRPVQVVGSSGTARGILLLDDAASLVDCAGGVEINANGTLTMSAGEVRCSRDWEETAASASFVPTGGTVTFQGTAVTQTITSQAANSFPAIRVGLAANGPTVVLANNVTCTDLDVVEGTFAPGAGRTVTKTGASTTDVQAEATLQLGAGTVLKLAGGAALNVNASGTLSTSGTSASSRARIENNGAGSYGVTISGTMGVDYITIGNLTATGVVVNATGTLTGWTGVRFTSGAAGGVYIDASLAGAASLPATINLCQFDTGPTFNVKSGGAGTTHTNVTFSNWAGARGGEQYETDDNLDLVDWGSGAAVVLRTNDPLDGDVATYATLQDAINDATAANNVVEVRDNVIRDETLNLSALAFRVILDGVVLRPPGGSTAIIGSGDPTKEVLRNLVLVRDTASATPLLQNVANVIHCDVLGAFTTANPLITVTGGNTCLIENSIVGDPATWQADVDDPISNGGALTVNYSFVDRGAVYPGLNNANANPQFQNWDPITGGSGLYDVHLKPVSTCIDYAPAPSIAVETDFDRGLDFNTPDQNPGFGNPRRPIDARPDSTDGGGPDPSWDNNFAPANTYDVGADELGPLVTGTGNKPQGVPLWTNRAGAGIVADPDSFSAPITSFTFSPAVMYVAENMNVNQAGHDVRLVVYDMNDALPPAGALDILTTLDLDAFGVQKVHHITVIGAGTQDNLYLAVDLDGDADTTADAILAVQYTPSPSTLALRGAWATNPRTPAGTGTIGRFVIGQSDGLLYFVRGNGRIYRHKQTDGTPDGGVADPGDNWVDANGQLDLVAEGYDGKFDGEGSLFAGKFNNCIYAPTNQHANEILRIQCSDGGVAAAQTCGLGNRNHYGFNLISQSVFVTGADQYVWRIHEDTLAFNAWPAAVWPWESEPMGASVKTTTRAQMFRTVDANVRVGAGGTMYKFRKDTGVITDDSDGAGDDWGPGRAFRGNIITAPTLIGGTGKDYTPVADGRRCGKIVFGTDQGYCYVVGYIRATLASDAEDNDEPQPASSTIVGYDVLDGRPYHGFPYRIPGVKIVNISLLTSSAAGKQVIVFITDNGWAYGFIEPY